MVPSFSPFSMFAVTRFMLSDPSSKEGKERDSGEEKKGDSGQKNTKKQKHIFKCNFRDVMAHCIDKF